MDSASGASNIDITKHEIMDFCCKVGVHFLKAGVALSIVSLLKIILTEILEVESFENVFRDLGNSTFDCAGRLIRNQSWQGLMFLVLEFCRDRSLREKIVCGQFAQFSGVDVNFWQQLFQLNPDPPVTTPANYKHTHWRHTDKHNTICDEQCYSCHVPFTSA